MSMSSVDFSKLTTVEAMTGENVEETAQLQSLYRKAKVFLESFHWCAKVTHTYFGFGVSNVVAVFLFEFVTTSSAVDTCLWVIVGDIPPAYLVVDETPNPACALDSYIGEMEKWVDAILEGKPVDDLIPVDAPASVKNAMDLKKRLEFLDREILGYYKKDLI